MTVSRGHASLPVLVVLVSTSVLLAGCIAQTEGPALAATRSRFRKTIRSDLLERMEVWN